MPTQKTPTKRPTKTKPARSIWIWVLTCTLIIALVASMVVYASAFAKTDRPAQTLTVSRGDTYHHLLVKNHWQTHPLSSSLMARLYLKMHAKGTLEAGTYEIPQGASLATVVKILGQGSSVAMIKIQIIEGKTIKDLYQTLKNTDGITLELLTPKADGYSWADVARDNASVAKALNIDSPNGHLEGLFAPDTYLFAKGVSDREILKRLYHTQKATLDKAWANRAKDLPYQSPYQALIMASIIEKETGIKAERGDVSAVFVNRLRQGMRLQTDPTIIYGLFDRYDGKIYKSNISEKTAYNTYQIDGLPPTPIALPSAEAIEATMHPTDVPYLYFVATGNGGHKFSVTLDEHNKAVADYRKVMANKQNNQSQ